MQKVAIKQSIVFHPATVKNLKLAQRSLHALRNCFTADPLQNFAEDDVGEGHSPARQFSIKPLRLGACSAAEIIYPDGGVDDNHTSSPRSVDPIAPHGLEIPFPFHRSPEPPNIGLSFGSN